MSHFSLIHAVREPVGNTREPAPLLILLHGVGSNEQDLIGLAPALIRGSSSSALVPRSLWATEPTAGITCSSSQPGTLWITMRLRAAESWSCNSSVN